MIPEIKCCCKVKPSWVFVYDNNEVWGICGEHFESPYHQYHVEFVINIKTRILSKPSEIFVGVVA